MSARCKSCEGDGWTWLGTPEDGEEYPCPACNGTGRDEQATRLDRAFGPVQEHP